MDPPLILVVDHTSHPPITTNYLSGTNELDLKPIYTRIKSLLAHPICSHRPFSSGTWPCPSCEQAFQDQYWTCAAHLLDYFADFHPTDTPLMHSIWFHLLDVWQEASAWLPCDAALDCPISCKAVHGARLRAVIFTQHVKDTMELFGITIFGQKARSIPRDPIMHDPAGLKESPAGEYETGPWVSGLKPWQQFLCEGSPGVAAPLLASLAEFGTRESEDSTTGDVMAAATGTPTAAQDGSSSGSTTTAHARIRHVPMPGIAIVARHTQRARGLAVKLASKLADAAQQDTTTSNNAATSSNTSNTSSTVDPADILPKFDSHALKFPTPTNLTHNYTSPLTHHTITYTLTNGAPLISRYSSYGDPNMLLDDDDELTFTLVDECVGVCKGVQAYEVVGEVGGEDGDEEDSEDDNGDEEEEVFDMWSVCESGEGVEREAGGEGGEGMEKRGSELGSKLKGYEDMFEEWCDEGMY